MMKLKISENKGEITDNHDNDVIFSSLPGANLYEKSTNGPTQRTSTVWLLGCNRYLRNKLVFEWKDFISLNNNLEKNSKTNK